MSVSEVGGGGGGGVGVARRLQESECDGVSVCEWV